MNRLQVITVSILILSSVARAGDYVPRAGDILFQSTRSPQGKAIELATRSAYSHVGIVFMIDSGAVVLEAKEPVRTTPLADWIANGRDSHFVAMRLVGADSILTEEALDKMLSIGREFVGKSYDLYFMWSDDRIYCSELVWKIYQRSLGIEIGASQKMKDFDLTNPLVSVKLRERFGDNVPLEEQVISPGAMFESKRLTKVYESSARLSEP